MYEVIVHLLWIGKGINASTFIGALAEHARTGSPSWMFILCGFLDEPDKDADESDLGIGATRARDTAGHELLRRTFMCSMPCRFV